MLNDICCSSPGHVWLWDHMDCSTSGLPGPHHLLEFAQVHVHCFGDTIQPSHPLSSPSPSAFNLSQHQAFSNESAVHILWPKCLNFSFSISPFNEYSGFISLMIYWFDLAVQGTFRSLLQYHSSKASIIWHSAFFIVQLSQPYVTTGKTIALNIWSFVNRVMSLLFNKLSRFIVAFLPRSNHLLIL